MAPRLGSENRSERSHINAIARLFCGTTAPNGFTTAHVPARALRRITASGPQSGSGSGASASSVQAGRRSVHQSVL